MSCVHCLSVCTLEYNLCSEKHNVFSMLTRMLATNVSIPNLKIARLGYLGWLGVTQGHLQSHNYQATYDF